MKISGTDAENHEESENSIEIVQKFENQEIQTFQVSEKMKISVFVDPPLDHTTSVPF